MVRGRAASGILNFAPRKLFVPDSVALRSVNMAIELESLSFALAQGEPARRPGRRSRSGADAARLARAAAP